MLEFIKYLLTIKYPLNPIIFCVFGLTAIFWFHPSTLTIKGYEYFSVASLPVWTFIYTGVSILGLISLTTKKSKLWTLFCSITVGIFLFNSMAFALAKAYTGIFSYGSLAWVTFREIHDFWFYNRFIDNSKDDI